MTSTLLIVQIVLAIAITIAVLLQKSSSIGLGAYSGSNESVFGAKGPTGFLSKATFILAFTFIVNTLALGYLYTSQNSSSIADTIVPKNNAAIPATPVTPAAEKTAPTAPAAPAAPVSK
jgi:preprotein translocase subunit SecG